MSERYKISYVGYWLYLFCFYCGRDVNCKVLKEYERKGEIEIRGICSACSNEIKNYKSQYAYATPLADCQGFIIQLY